MPEVTEEMEKDLDRWTSSIYYRQIRAAESLLPGQKSDGHRLRGVTLAPNLYLARDKYFYEIVDGVAMRMDLSRVLEMYDIETLKKLFEQTQISAGV